MHLGHVTQQSYRPCFQQKPKRVKSQTIIQTVFHFISVPALTEAEKVLENLQKTSGRWATLAT